MNMDGYDYRGRRVVDPKPVLRNPDSLKTGSKDLDAVWNKMTSAKSALRRAEFNLEEAERPPLNAESYNPHSGVPHNPHSTVPVPKIPKYRIDNKEGMSSETFVDKYGRTHHMRSKMADSNRKVSRLENKYKDEPALDPYDSRERSPLREANHLPLEERYGPRRLHGTHSLDNVTTKVSWDADPKINKLVDRYKQKYLSEQQETEADANFLNDFTVNHRKPESGPHFTKVNVKVPSNKYDGVSSTVGLSRSSEEVVPRGILKVRSEGYDWSAPSGSDVNDTYTKSSDIEANHRRKKALKNLEKHSDSLAKVRNVIKRQRMSNDALASDSDAMSRASSESLDHRSSHPPPEIPARETQSRQLHAEDEPVVKRTKDGESGSHITRKIAVGSKAPSYKGFSEAETRYHSSEARIVKTSNAPRKKLDRSPPPPPPPVVPVRNQPPVPRRDRPQEPRTAPEAKESRKAEPKKMTRVVAVKKQPAQGHAKSEHITTHSWREGQRAILKELGPMKVTKAPTAPTIREMESMEINDDNSTKEVTRAPVVEDREVRRQPPKSSTEGEQRGILSKEAHSVLADLHESSDSEEDDHRDAKDPKRSSRSRPKSVRPHEPEPELGPRVKHYDSSKVRQYIAKQRADRRRRQQEEDDLRRKSAAERQRQLEDLYKKQKESARPGPGKPRPTGHDGSRGQRGAEGDGEDGKSDTYQVNEVKTKTKREKPVGLDSGGSSDNSTLTEITDSQQKDSIDDTDNRVPTPPPRSRKGPSGTVLDKSKPSKQEIDTQLLLNKYLSNSSERDPSKPPEVPQRVPLKPTSSATASTSRTEANMAAKVEEILNSARQKTGMSVDDIVSKYAGKAEVIKSTFSHKEKPAQVLTARDLLDSKTNSTRGVGGVMDRIQAIKNTSTSLQTRLQMESHRLAMQDRWAAPREDTDFVSRHQNLVGRKEDYRVFDRDLPGVKSSSVTAQRAHETGHKTDAATKIQAAYRGHSVRQSLTWRTPEHKMVASTPHHKKDVLPSDSDGFSDSTLTEDSMSDNLDFKTPKRHTRPMDLDQLQPSKVKHVSRLQPVKADHSREKDPYNVFSVYRNRQKTVQPAPGTTARVTYSEAFEVSYQTDPKSRDHKATSQPKVSDEDVDESSLSSLTPVQVSRSGKSSRKDSSQLKTDSRYRDDKSIHSDDYLDNTLTESLISDIDPKDDTGRSYSLVPSKAKQDKDSDWSDVSSLTDDSEPITRPKYSSVSGSSAPPQLAPAALQQRMAAELTQLESLEDALRQLSDVERVRAVSLAQQETVSLAQILKSRQQAHSRDLAELQIKAQQEAIEAQKQLEATRQQETTRQLEAQKQLEASRQLDEAQRRAAEAVRAIAELRAEPRGASATRQLIETQTEAAKATAQATKHLAESVKRDHSTQYSSQESQRSKYGGPTTADTSKYTTTNADTSKYATTTADSLSTSYTPSEDLTPTYGDSFDSYTRSSPPAANKRDDSLDSSTGSQTVSSAVVTAEDLSRRYDKTSSSKTTSVSLASELKVGDNDKSPDSSIHTESHLHDSSAARGDNSERDMTVDFDTEEDLERSMREILPSEGQRKMLRQQSFNDTEPGYQSLEEFKQPAESRAKAKRNSFESDSFSRFTIDMVSQYMRDDEIRARYQNTLLKLREEALVEKTKAELAWIEQQKQRLSNKGADDSYPQLRQKKRGIIRRLKEEQAEIKRLKEAQRAASKEREMLRKQTVEIEKFHKTAHKYRSKLKKSDTKLEETDISIHHDDDSETSAPTSPTKEKSDSELQESFHKLKLMKLDREYLRRRESRLAQRRERAEEMRALKRMLDDEERRIADIEREVGDLEKVRERQREDADRSYEMIEGSEKLQLTLPGTPRNDPQSDRLDTGRSIPESIYTEKTDTARSVPESAYTEKTDTTRSVPESAYTEKSATGYSSKYTSIAEDITNTSSPTHKSRRTTSNTDTSIAEEVRTHDDTEINSTTVHDDYSETFDTAAPTAQTSQSQTSRAPSRRVVANGHANHSPNNNNIRKTSESESEDSFSVAHSELSDASEVETRIRALTSELKRRKLEAERLKRQSAQRRKDKLKQQEEQLKQQIESYDRYIDQYKSDLTRSPEHSEHVTRPHIMPPSAKLVSAVGDRAVSVDRRRTDADSAKSGELSPRRPAEPPRRPKDKMASVTRPAKALPPTPTEPASVISAARTDVSAMSAPKTDISVAKTETSVVKTDISVAKTDTSAVKTETSVARTELSEALTSQKDEKTSEPLFALEPAVEEKLPIVTPRSARESRLDSMRSVSEIPEDVSDYDQSPRTDTEDMSPRMVAKESQKDDVSTQKSLDEASTPQTEVTTQRTVRSETIEPSSARSEKSQVSSARSEKSYVSSYSDDYTSDTHTSDQSSYTASSYSRTESAHSERPSEKKSSTPEVSDQTIQEESVHDEQSTSSGVMLQMNEPAVSLTKDPLEEFQIGERVLLPEEQMGTLRFKGFVKFAPGQFAGVDLDLAEGENDGSVEDMEYFKCAPKHGVFVLPEKLSKLSEDQEVSLKKKREIEQIISHASEAVESFLKEQSKTKDSDEESIGDVPDLEEDEEKKVEEEDKKTNKVDEATNMAVKNLLDDALSQMMKIREMKRAKVESRNEGTKTPEEEEDVEDKAPAVPAREVITPRKPAEDPVLATEAASSEVNRPMSSLGHLPDIGQTSTEFLDDEIYNFGADDTDDLWNDDELFGSQLTKDKHLGDIDKEELRLDLTKLTTEAEKPESVRYHVPNTSEEVTRIIRQTVDFYWERRRYGESWSDVPFPTETLLDVGESGPDPVGKSRQSYKHVVFDLTSEVLRDMYREEDEEVETNPVWMKQRLPKRRYHKQRSPPTTVDDLQPIVTEHVLSVLGFQTPDAGRVGRKWGIRKKKDRVDEILVTELRAEEPHWVNYDDDELAVKNQIADSLFESLLIDTASAVGRALVKRSV